MRRLRLDGRGVDPRLLLLPPLLLQMLLLLLLVEHVPEQLLLLVELVIMLSVLEELLGARLERLLLREVEMWRMPLERLLRVWRCRPGACRSGCAVLAGPGLPVRARAVDRQARPLGLLPRRRALCGPRSASAAKRRDPAPGPASLSSLCDGFFTTIQVRRDVSFVLVLLESENARDVDFDFFFKRTHTTHAHVSALHKNFQEESLAPVATPEKRARAGARAAARSQARRPRMKGPRKAPRPAEARHAKLALALSLFVS